MTGTVTEVQKAGGAMVCAAPVFKWCSSVQALWYLSFTVKSVLFVNESKQQSTEMLPPSAPSTKFGTNFVHSQFSRKYQCGRLLRKES